MISDDVPEELNSLSVLEEMLINKLLPNILCLPFAWWGAVRLLESCHRLPTGAGKPRRRITQAPIRDRCAADREAGDQWHPTRLPGAAGGGGGSTALAAGEQSLL